MARTLYRSLFAIALVSVVGVGLAACTTDDVPEASSTASVTPPSPSSTPTVTAPVESTTPTATPSSTPTPTPAPTNIGTAVGITCSQLVTAQQMYEFNPNFTLSDDYTPKAGSRAATVVGYKGLACEWVNDSSHEKIDIAVANLGDASASIQAARAAKSKPVSTFGTTGFFTVSGTKGLADAFPGSYWIVADSTYFTTAVDAKLLVTDAIGSLPH